MRKNALVWLQETIISKNNDLESSFDEEHKDPLKNQLWSYKFTSENKFRQKFRLKSWFKWKKEKNRKL